MGLFVRIFFCLSAGFLSSCNVSLPLQTQLKHLKSSPNLDRALKHSIDTKFFTKGKWPQEKWWVAYNSPELNTLIEEALSNNPSLQAIHSRVNTAKEEAMVTRSLLFPLLFFDASVTRQYLSKNGLYRAFNSKLPRNATLIDLTLSFSYEFDFWGKNHNLFCAAVGEALAAEAEAAQVELIVSTAITQAYLAYKVNLLKKTLYEQLVTLRQQIYQLQQLVLTKGLESTLPSFSATERLFEAKQQLSAIETELAVDKHLINILAGRGPDSSLGLGKKLPLLPKTLTIPKNLSLDLISRRPDLMAQIWRAKALAHETGAAMAEFYPDVNISAFIGLESVKWKTLLDISSAKTGIKPALHLPIFTAGAIAANIRGKKAAFETAIFDYNELLLRSTQEVLDLLAFAEDVYKQKKEQSTIIQFAKERYNLTALRQQKGLDSNFDLFLLKEEVIKTEIANLSLLYNQYLASIKLIKAIGGGYHKTYIPLVKT